MIGLAARLERIWRVHKARQAEADYWAAVQRDAEEWADRLIALSKPPQGPRLG